MTPLSVSVPALFKTYKANPAALAKALEGLVNSHVEAREARSAKDQASATCRKLHPDPSSRVVCEGCFLAALERINGE